MYIVHEIVHTYICFIIEFSTSHHHDITMGKGDLQKPTDMCVPNELSKLSQIQPKPEQQKEEIRKITTTDALISILKINIGTGILALPDAYKNSGTIAGTIGGLKLI